MLRLGWFVQRSAQVAVVTFLLAMLPLVPLPPAAHAQRAASMQINPSFILLQGEDGSIEQCQSLAPESNGTLALALDFEAGTASGSLHGSGAGSKGLCVPDMTPAATAQLDWTVSYDATFTGAVGPDGGFDMVGTLSGDNGYTNLHDCTSGFEVVDCAALGFAPGSMHFSFEVDVNGTVDPTSGASTGTITLTDIGLPTLGQWDTTADETCSAPTAAAADSALGIQAGFTQQPTAPYGLRALAPRRADPIVRAVGCGDPDTRVCCALGGWRTGAGLMAGNKLYGALDPTALGGHQYGGHSRRRLRYHNDPVGFVYTSQVGLLDLGHVRDNADMTRFVYNALAAGATQLRLYEGSVTITSPPSDEESRQDMAGAIAYAEGWAHELTTWGTFAQDYSSFSPEDLPSNMVGIELAKRAITRSLTNGGSPADNATWNSAVDAELQAMMTALGARPQADTLTVLAKIEATGSGTGWFRTGYSTGSIPGGRYIPHLALVRRNFDGTPWMAGMAYDAPATLEWLDSLGFELNARTDFTYVVRSQDTFSLSRRTDVLGLTSATMTSVTQGIRDAFVAAHPGMDGP